jgi:hypothetical protein
LEWIVEDMVISLEVWVKDCIERDEWSDEWVKIERIDGLLVN